MRGITATLEHLLWTLETLFTGTDRRQQVCAHALVKRSGQHPSQAIRAQHTRPNYTQYR